MSAFQQWKMIGRSLLTSSLQVQRSQVEVDSDDEDVSFTQPTLTQVQRARENFTPVQIDRKVRP